MRQSFGKARDWKADSLGHTLDHLGLNGAIAVVLAVEVLRLVTHAVACVAHNGDLDLLVVRHLLLFAVLVRSHGDLEPS